MTTLFTVLAGLAFGIAGFGGLFVFWLAWSVVADWSRDRHRDRPRPLPPATARQLKLARHANRPVLRVVRRPGYTDAVPPAARNFEDQ